MLEMFSSLKNKIRDEKGTEVKFNNNLRGTGNGRLSSTVSISSIDEASSTSEISSLRSQIKDLQAKLLSLSTQLEESNIEKTRLEKANEILLESVKVSQTQKELYCQEQEQIQNIQTDEIEKLRKLLSFREQEALDRLVSMQNNQQQIENLTSELERLKPLEAMVEDLQVNVHILNFFFWVFSISKFKVEQKSAIFLVVGRIDLLTVDSQVVSLFAMFTLGISY